MWGTPGEKLICIILLLVCFLVTVSYRVMNFIKPLHVSVFVWGGHPLCVFIVHCVGGSKTLLLCFIPREGASILYGSYCTFIVKIALVFAAQKALNW